MTGLQIVRDFCGNFLPNIRMDVFGLAGKKAKVELEMDGGNLERKAMSTILHSFDQDKFPTAKLILRVITKLQTQKIISNAATPNQWARCFVMKMRMGSGQFDADEQRFYRLKHGLGPLKKVLSSFR